MDVKLLGAREVHGLVNKFCLNRKSIGMKRCSRCGVWKDLDGFHRNKYGLNGRNSQCKECRKKPIEKWQHGYDGLLAAILRRAKLDWDGMVDVTPARAERFAAKSKGNTLALDTCRFALSVGFNCPSQEIETFLASDYLRGWLQAVNCDEMLERLRI